ncbi:hypothetical protein [Nitrosomonas sp. Nm34]|uniref:hypothetical protein n=1 Tax=Nitrosomonas sp. Nm34 TaxID=1881055 RepID=UPI0008E77169|nr:hypothetical protein [Nitrosomonas sp. Nm34]SFI68571.1 hypothetical protein SAMN05428978_102618 [Nitrosomonas sp. Nm34]
MKISNSLNLLRDPIWASIAAFVAIIGSIMNYADSSPDRLSIVPNHAFSKLSEFLPNTKIKFSIEEETIELKNLFYTYLWVQNNSSSNIKPGDFLEKIGIKSISEDLEIILVTSCKDLGNLSLTKINTPSFVWSKNDLIWEVEPELINSGEGGCSLIIVKSNQVAPINMNDFKWSGRVIGNSIKIYDSRDDYYQDNKKLSDYLFIYIFMTTSGLIWFFIIQSVLSLISILLINKVWFSTKLTLTELSKIYFTFLLTITTSEIIVSIFINLDIQHPIAWLLLLLHFLVLCILAYKAYLASIQAVRINNT